MEIISGPGRVRGPQSSHPHLSGMNSWRHCKENVGRAHSPYPTKICTDCQMRNIDMPDFTLVLNGISAKKKPLWQHLPDRRPALKAGARFGLEAHALMDLAVHPRHLHLVWRSAVWRAMNTGCAKSEHSCRSVPLRELQEISQLHRHLRARQYDMRRQIP